MQECDELKKERKVEIVYEQYLLIRENPNILPEIGMWTNFLKPAKIKNFVLNCDHLQNGTLYYELWINFFDVTSSKKPHIAYYKNLTT